MSAADNEAIGRRFFADQDRLGGGPSPDLSAANYTAVINGFPPLDRAGHHQMAIGFYGAFPDMTQHIEETVADEQGVALRFRAAGKPIDVVGTAILRIENGKVASLKEVFDLQALLQQIGAAPS